MSKLHSAICRAAGVPDSTNTDAAITALAARWDKRAAAAGLPAGTPVPDVIEAERRARDAARLSAALRAAGGTSPATVGGVRLLSREEAEEIQAFGLDSPLLRRRTEATELALGKDLRAALADGDLT